MKPQIIDCEVHLLHPEGCTKQFLEGHDDPVRKAVHEHSDFTSIQKLLGIDALLQSMDKNGIVWSLIMGMPWKEESVLMDNNRYIEACVKKYPDRLKGMYIPFLGDPKRAAKEIENLDKKIFMGVKILPRNQSAHVDEDRLAPIYEAVQKKDMFLMIHTDHIHQTDTGDTPFRLMNFLLKYPKIKVLAPHLGGLICLYASRPKVKEAIKNVHFICSVSATMELASFAAQINPDNLIFGTDFPFNHCHNQHFQIEELSRLGLSKDVQEKILFKNAQKLFGNT